LSQRRRRRKRQHGKEKQDRWTHDEPPLLRAPDIGPLVTMLSSAQKPRSRNMDAHGQRPLSLIADKNGSGRVLLLMTQLV
jgi:hypothetical protein